LNQDTFDGPTVRVVTRKDGKSCCLSPSAGVGSNVHLFSIYGDLESNRPVNSSAYN
jgi:hypothetical protein